jgi:hypothetical protein
MKMQIISVKDRVADAYGRPFYTQSIGTAIRSFSDEINRDAADNQMFAHPDDYDLYHLGEFDDATAEFSLLTTPHQLILGKQAKK